MNHKHLVICNAYPSTHDIYKNGFIHRRVKSYIKKGLSIEVFCLHRKFENLVIETYDGVNILRGNREHYEAYLKQNDFQSYLIHWIVYT